MHKVTLSDYLNEIERDPQLSHGPSAETLNFLKNYSKAVQHIPKGTTERILPIFNN